MEYLTNIGTDGQTDMIVRSDGTIYTFDHETSQDEYGSIIHTCKGYLISQEELEGVHNGRLPQGFAWNDFLHKMFRTYQHQRADNEYIYAQRMYRSSNDVKWTDYIQALDDWNASVSATANGYSVNIPDMPVRP